MVRGLLLLPSSAQQGDTGDTEPGQARRFWNGGQDEGRKPVHLQRERRVCHVHRQVAVGQAEHLPLVGVGSQVMELYVVGCEALGKEERIETEDQFGRTAEFPVEIELPHLKMVFAAEDESAGGERRQVQFVERSGGVFQGEVTGREDVGERHLRAAGHGCTATRRDLLIDAGLDRSAGVDGGAGDQRDGVETADFDAREPVACGRNPLHGRHLVGVVTQAQLAVVITSPDLEAAIGREGVAGEVSRRDADQVDVQVKHLEGNIAVIDLLVHPIAQRAKVAHSPCVDIPILDRQDVDVSSRDGGNQLHRWTWIFSRKEPNA